MKQNIAKVTKAFPGVPDNEVAVRKFKPGDEVSGELAIVAVVNGWAEFAETKAISAAPENKAKDGSFQGSDDCDYSKRSEPKRSATKSRKKATASKS